MVPHTGLKTSNTFSEKDLSAIRTAGLDKVKEQNSLLRPLFSHYLLNNENTCSGKVDVLICVHTHPSHSKVRDVIRQTWANQKHWLTYRVRTLFFTGITSIDKSLQEALEMESDVFMDIIQADFEDSYRNLTFKALSVLHWVHKYCSNSAYVFKVDDDVIVNIFSLQELMPLTMPMKMEQSSFNADLRLHEHQIACSTFQNITVKRAGKWAVKEEELPADVKIYPQFCAGMGYLMYTSTALALYDVAKEVPFFWIDDIYVTGFLANRIKTTYLSFNDHIIYSDKDIITYFIGRRWTNYYLAHTKNTKLMMLVWNKLAKLSRGLTIA